MKREIPLYTLEGVKDAKVTPYYFNTEDGLGLSMLRFQRGEPKESVMIIHGLTTSTDMFIMPEHYNLVSYLLDHGYVDVWCFDFRMSNRYSYNLFKHRYTHRRHRAVRLPAGHRRSCATRSATTRST